MGFSLCHFRLRVTFWPWNAITPFMVKKGCVLFKETIIYHSTISHFLWSAQSNSVSDSSIPYKLERNRKKKRFLSIFVHYSFTRYVLSSCVPNVSCSVKCYQNEDYCPKYRKFGYNWNKMDTFKGNCADNEFWFVWLGKSLAGWGTKRTFVKTTEAWPPF